MLDEAFYLGVGEWGSIGPCAVHAALEGRVPQC
jgi:hypothetical protein